LRICYPDRERQRLFTRAAHLKIAYGDHLAALIRCRMSVIDAVQHLGLVASVSLFELASEGRSAGRFSIGIDSEHRLYFKAIADFPLKQSTPLEAISHIQVFGVDQPESKKVFRS
jgi:plasmid maintenance system killer protein